MKLTIKGATVTVTGKANEFEKVKAVVSKLARVYRRANTEVKIDEANFEASFVFEKIFGASATTIRKAYAQAKA